MDYEEFDSRFREYMSPLGVQLPDRGGWEEKVETVTFFLIVLSRRLMPWRSPDHVREEILQSARHALDRDRPVRFFEDRPVRRDDGAGTERAALVSGAGFYRFVLVVEGVDLFDPVQAESIMLVVQRTLGRELGANPLAG